MFLLDNRESMQDFPQPLPEAFTPGFSPPAQTTAPGRRGWLGREGDFVNTGCSDPALVAAMSWFDKDSGDPSKNGSTVYDADPDFSPTPFFEADKFYHARGRRVAWLTEDFPSSLLPFGWRPAIFGEPSTLGACYQVVNWNTSDYHSSPGSPELMDECQACLATRGWWRGPRISARTGADFNDDDFPPNRKTPLTGEEPTSDSAYRKWVVSGRVLNVRPPKFVVARKVLKDVISLVPDVRMGVATFGDDHGWFDPPKVLSGMRPSCDLSVLPLDEAALDRAQLRRAVNQTNFRNNERSTGEALFGLGGYFSSQRQDSQWGNWFTQPLAPGFGWPGCCTGGTSNNPDTGQEGLFWGMTTVEWLKPPYVHPVTGEPRPGQPWEGTGSDKSVCFADQRTAVIVLTGGTPRYDNTVPITRMMELLMANGARHPDGSLVQFDPTNPETHPNVGGINYCDQVVKNPLTGETFTKADCDYTAYNWPHGLGGGNKNFMDDVSFFLAHTDLRGDLPGTQSVRTYVVGYGDSSPMLQSIARAGQGSFLRADTDTELRNALLSSIGALWSSSPSP